jgi:charged multivesicular body protein 3
MRNLDRDISNLKRAEDKALKECKKLAQSGNVKSAKILAKEIVRSVFVDGVLTMIYSCC